MRPPPILLALLALPPAAGCTIDRTYRTPVTPQRPTVSSNTNTTATGTVELETGIASDPGERFGTPSTLKYGVDERTEITLGFEPFASIDADGFDGSGIGDLTPGMRRRLVDQDGASPAVGYLVAAKIPTASADKGLGSGETDLFFAGIVHWDDPAWSANGYYQLGLLGEPGDSGVDLQQVLTVAGSRPLEAGIEAFGELAFLWTPEQDEEVLLAIGGLTYAYRPGIVFDASVALGLTDDAPDAVLQIGTTVNFGPQRWRIRP